MIDEIMEEHFRLFMNQGEPFSPHDLALAHEEAEVLLHDLVDHSYSSS